MIIIGLKFLTISLAFWLTKCDKFDDNCHFTVYNNLAATKGSNWNSTTKLGTLGCDVKGKLSLLTHGWQGSNSDWMLTLVEKLLKYRGGCVIQLTWGKYSDNKNYVEVLMQWQKVSEMVTRRLQSMEREGISADNMFLYGHSLGARIMVDAAIRFGKQKIASIDACDPAGPGFNYVYWKNSKDGAKNVQCIHTSTNAGTFTYNCHQDWLMGYCGVAQPAADDFMALYCEANKCNYQPINSHSLCNNFYINAFENDYVANNYYNCSNVLDVKKLPIGFKMGYMETRRNSYIVGKIAAPSSKISPYNGK